MPSAPCDRGAVPGGSRGDRLADLPGAGPVGALQRRREQRIGPDGAGADTSDAEVTWHG